MTKTPICIPKKKLKLRICVWTPIAWPRTLESTLPFKIPSLNSWETTQLSELLSVTMPLWQSNNLGIILCHQRFLVYCLSLTCWKLLSFLESISFFSCDFKNIKHLIILVNPNTAIREPPIIFIALMVSSSANWSAWPYQYVKWIQSRLYTLLLQPCWMHHHTLI